MKAVVIAPGYFNDARADLTVGSVIRRKSIAVARKRTCACASRPFHPPAIVTVADYGPSNPSRDALNT